MEKNEWKAIEIWRNTVIDNIMLSSNPILKIQTEQPEGKYEKE
jgi:hypothetical protein